MSNVDTDRAFMEQAVQLASAQLGQVWPNPAVGCVLVAGDKIVGEGATAKNGRPHAEQIALEMAGDKARGATAYVSLEPCAHEGKTPSCAKALVTAGVTRVIYACEDPDPRVSGKGGEVLKAAGVKVETGIMQAEAEALNQGFFLNILENRPMVSLKLATSNDGKIFDPHVSSPWITSAASRDKGHAMRADHDAILVGVGTVLADDPMLTCRLAGFEARSPVRIVLDSKWRTPLASKLVQTASQYPTWIVGLGQAPAEFMVLGMKCLSIEDKKDISELLALLANEGITRLMVEGGSKINTSFAHAGLIDHVAWFKAPYDIGDGGLDAFSDMKVDEFLDAAKLKSVNNENIGKDRLENFIKAE